MKDGLKIIGVVIVLGLLSACVSTAGSDDNILPEYRAFAQTVHPASAYESSQGTVEIINDTDQPILYFYVSESTADSWGPNLLLNGDQARMLWDGEAIIVDLSNYSSSVLDIRAIRSDRQREYLGFAVDLSQGEFVLEIDNEDDRFLNFEAWDRFMEQRESE